MSEPEVFWDAPIIREDSDETIVASQQPSQSQALKDAHPQDSKYDEQIKNGNRPSNENDPESGNIEDNEFVSNPPINELPAGVIDPEKADGDVMVEWDGMDDKENAQSWPTVYRYYITLLVGILTFCSTFASSAPSQLLPRIMERYQVSEEAAKVPVFVYLAGYMFGPLFWGPLSELYGVMPMVWASGLGMAAFNVACAHSPNLGGLIMLRIVAGMFGSCPLTIGGGVMAHIWRKEQLGIGMCVFGSAPMGGPSLGPLIGGWIAASGTTYQWIFWSLGIFTGALTILMGLTMKETNPSINLRRKARRIRNATGNERYKAPIEVRKIDFRELATQRLAIPLHMLLVRY